MSNGEFMLGWKDYFPPTPGDEDNTLTVRLWYPGIGSSPDSRVQIGLDAVRCAEDLQIGFDFKANDWVVYQRGPHTWHKDDNDIWCMVDGPWLEVARLDANGLDTGSDEPPDD